MQSLFHSHNVILTPTVTYDADAQAYFDAVASSGDVLTTTQKGAINTLILAFKTSGSAWSKTKLLNPAPGNSAAANKWNAKDPRDLDAAYRLTFPNGATHSTALGFTLNGTNQYAETFLNPSTALTLNSVFLGSYNKVTGSGALISCTSGDATQNLRLENTSIFHFDCYGANNRASNSLLGYSGFSWGNRTSSTSSVLGRNTNTVLTRVTAQTGTLPTVTLNIGRNNKTVSLDSYSNMSYQIIIIADGLTGTELTGVQNAVIAYETTLGRN